MFDTLGDVMAKQIVSETTQCMDQEVEPYHGRVIRTIGDEVMAELPCPEQGFLAAIAMHLSLAKHNASTGKNTQIRVGFNCGDIIHEDGDVYGDAVNVASRMVDQCHPGQILTTQGTAAIMPASVSDTMRSLGTSSLKGKEMDIEVFEILWQDDRSKLRVVSRHTPSFNEELSPSLCLEYQKNRVTIQKRGTPFVLGRNSQTNLWVDDDRVSHIHAAIEHHQGQYNLSDRSTNGTWTCLGHRERLFFHQESLLLHSASTIGLGKDWRNFSTHNIDFRVDED